MNETSPQPLAAHVIVCGMGHVGYRVAELLHALGEPFTVITLAIRPEWRETIQAHSLHFVEGDARTESSLQAAGIQTARAVLIVTNNDLTNIEIALDVQRLNPNVPLIVRVFDRYLGDRARHIPGVRNVLSTALLTAPVFVANALGEAIVRAFTIEDCPLNVIRLHFTADSPGIGRQLDHFCAERGLIPLTVHREGDTSEEGVFGEAGIPLSQGLLEHRLTSGDEVIGIATGPVTEELRQAGFLPRTQSRPGRWQNLARFGRNLLQQPLSPIHLLRQMWGRTPWVLRAALLLLLTLVVCSVFVFHRAIPNHPSWVDALYFTVTTITTVGFGDYNLHDAPWWLKLYGCVVMVAGAALAAILFGIITDYIVSLRVEQALGRQQLFLSNHIVVIGLGDVGTRVVEELARKGEQVVVIERESEYEAVPPGVHVLIGDAMRPSVMQQANIREARAAIVTTTNDLDSLRMAHQAEMLNANLRSVVRIYDSELARKLGGGMGIDHAVNAAQTAAATFVATALQIGVEYGFTLGKHLFLLRWLTPEERQTRQFSGKTVETLHAEGHFVLLKRTEEGGKGEVRPLTSQEILSPETSLLILEAYPNRTLLRESLLK